ncbi:hypothetical protein NQ317_012969 [Molorchus minor]|uniref:ISXO2-like transposase domain-containing protein n=1 Tax=Molorchus minor TaxID=1323400 RepID=A0ABQ9JFQ1_9CUCU|nr:hypothetical protein NQ317_012969 [Molorchus minor]
MSSFCEPSTSSSNTRDCDFNECVTEVFIYWATEQSEQIGGEGTIVEIDEAKIGRRKYNRGRYLQGQWVFGGIERGTLAVEDRTSDTLLKIIQEKIKPGTTIFSDCWKAYECLSEKNYQHLTVNYSVNFIDPETGTHTQNIERVWAEVRKLVPRYGRHKKHYEGYLAECLFVMRHSDHRGRFHAFWKVAAELYKPLPHYTSNSNGKR